MKKRILPIVAILAAAAVHACKDVPAEPEDNDPGKKTEKTPGKDPEKEKPILNPWHNLPYKLNVIYFVPKDADTLPAYRERISGILLNLQQFFGREMELAGYGRKSFGLRLLADDQVDMVTLRSEMTKQEAVNGYQRARNEVKAYFGSHPEKRNSDHNLIIMPTFHDDPKNPGGPPFFGVGRDCFALDYPGMAVSNLGTDGVDGDLATKWIGGMAHELGHGLNAPHNKERRTEQRARGTALMGTGNYTYGRKPTYLTSASAALFATAQPFATKTRADWYQDLRHNLIKIKGERRDGKIVISGSYYSSLPVSTVIVYHDREPYGGNKDYDAMAWAAQSVDENSFRVECPLADFYERNGKYELKVDFYHENGTKKGHKFYYAFDGDQNPRVETINTKDIMDRKGWQVVETDSYNPGDEGSNLLDGDPESVWHTKWKGGEDPLPHHFVVDMGAVRTIGGFAFANRGNLNGAMKDIEIFGSGDGKQWASLGTFRLEAKTGWQYIDLPQSYGMRYVKTVATSTNKAFKYTHLGEFAAY